MRIGSASRFAIGGALVVLMLATVPGTGLARRHEQKAPPPGRGEPARSASGPHPTLYFRPDAADFRNRGSEGVLKESRDLVLFTADWALRVKIPSEPARREKLPADGSYSTAGLVSAKDFLDAGVTIQSVVPVLGVAYHLTGDAKYARRAVEWLTAYSGWQNFDVSKPDIAGSGSVVGMTVGYDLLYHQMSPAERQRLLATITRVGTLYVAKARQLSKLPLRGNRVLIANDHNLVPVAAAGVAALLFKLEGVDNGEALDTVIACFRKSIIPAGFGPNGEFVDGTDNWLVYAMNSMTFFFEALRRNGGPNLWMEGNLPKVPEYWIQMDSIPAEDTPYNYRWRHTLLALASVYRNSELQGLALKHGLGITPEARQLNFTQQNAPEDAGKPVKRWWSAAWEFMFYDPSVKPAPLRSRPTSVAFPPRGDVILRSAWTKDATILTFRAGPRVGKAEGDNNAFQLKAVGHDFLPKLEVPFTRLAERGDASYDEMDKLLGTEGNNTIMVDGVRQYSRLDPRYRGTRAPKRQFLDWLAGPDEGVIVEAQISGFVHGSAIDYTAGDAANAYRDDMGNELLERFRRRIFFVKDDYVVIVDDIKSAGRRPRAIEWRFHAGRHNEIKATDRTFTVRPRDGGDSAKVDLHVLTPALASTVRRVEVKNEQYRSPYVAINTPQKQSDVLAVFVLDIKGGRRSPAPTIEVDDARRTVLKVGSDVLLLNKTSNPVDYEGLHVNGRAGWIRPGTGALLVEGTSLKWKGESLIDVRTATSAAWPK